MTDLTDAAHLSPPIDLSKPYDPSQLRGKTILITGGSSGIGAGFVTHWATHGATVINGDIDVARGEALAETVNASAATARAGGHVHFVRCDVTDWAGQVRLFQRAVALSPHGGLDVVVANAGISGAGADHLERPGDLSADDPPPPPPNLRVIDVNLIGVLYTTHLAYYWLPRNPGSAPAQANNPNNPNPQRDRHLLLLGSLASFSPIITLPLYGVTKHGVLGLWRCLRGTAFAHGNGIRVNLLAPYFVDTPLLGAGGRALLAGGAVGAVADVVDAATRLLADRAIVGRALFVGPRAWVRRGDALESVPEGVPEGEEVTVWEPFAEDWCHTEVFTRRIVAVLNAVEGARGWAGWVGDVVGAVREGLGLRGWLWGRR